MLRVYGGVWYRVFGDNNGSDNEDHFPDVIFVLPSGTGSRRPVS